MSVQKLKVLSVQKHKVLSVQKLKVLSVQKRKVLSVQKLKVLSVQKLKVLLTELKHINPTHYVTLHLQDGGLVLSWEQRLDILKGAACGLQYLHTVDTNKPVIHGDIKS